MKIETSVFLFLILPLSLAFGSSDPLAGRIEGFGAQTPEGYSPPLISNGDLSMLVEWTGGQSGIAYHKIKTEVYWQGRRGPAREAQLFGFGRFLPKLAVDGVEAGMPESWSQTLDVFKALVTCEGRFAKGLDVTTEVFCAWDRNVIAIRRVVRNSSSTGRKVRLDLGYDLPVHDRLVGAWCINDLYFETSPYLRMRGRRGLPNTDVRRIFHGLTYGNQITGFDITISASDGGTIIRETELAPGESMTAEWFITYSDTCEQKRTLVPEMSWKDLFAIHAKHWADYYKESFVKVPDARLQRMYDVQQYHLRCNVTRWGFPVGIFPSHWQGKYFGFDEMYIHDGLVSSGHFDLAKRCPEWRYAIMHRALRRQSHYAQRGKYGARWHWESLEDGDCEVADVGFWHDHIFTMGAVSRSAWTQYTYSGDVEYLEKIGYPVILECARFYRNNWMIEEGNNSARIGRCTDVERLGPSRDRAFLTTCSAIYSLRVAADAADILRLDKEEAADFRAAADRLENGLPVSSDGTRYVAYENCTEESVATLGGLYPFPIFTGDNDLQRNAARHFIDVGRSAGNMYPVGNKICTWYAAKMSASMTALGDHNESGRWLAEASSSTGSFGETWEINEKGVRMHPWFATASGCSVFAVNEMLIKGVVPETWRNYSFRLPDGRGGWIERVVVDGKSVDRLHGEQSK